MYRHEAMKHCALPQYTIEEFSGTADYTIRSLLPRLRSINSLGHIFKQWAALYIAVEDAAGDFVSILLGHDYSEDDGRDPDGHIGLACAAPSWLKLAPPSHFVFDML